MKVAGGMSFLFIVINNNQDLTTSSDHKARATNDLFQRHDCIHLVVTLMVVRMPNFTLSPNGALPN